MSRPQPSARGDYAHFQALSTRWMDNDVYGHVNNVVYYSYFDTAVNQYLIAHDVLRIGESSVIGLVVETGCSFFASVAFPDALEIGLRVASIGTSSVRYELGVFRAGEASASAQGHFVHVYVDAQTRRPTPLPDALRQALTPLLRQR